MHHIVNLAERHLIESIVDLKSRVEKSTQYDLIRASGILRQMLIDSPTLIDRANEKYREKILFTTIKKTKLESKSVQQDGMTWEPLISVSFIQPKRGHERSILKKSRFLSYQVFNFEDLIFTIKDVIKIAANVLGGVHFDKPKTSKDYKLLVANNMIQYADQTSACASSIREIANITIKAVEPLLEKIKTGA